MGRAWGGVACLGYAWQSIPWRGVTWCGIACCGRRGRGSDWIRWEGRGVVWRGMAWSVFVPPGESSRGVAWHGFSFCDRKARGWTGHDGKGVVRCGVTLRAGAGKDGVGQDPTGRAWRGVTWGGLAGRGTTTPCGRSSNGEMRAAPHHAARLRLALHRSAPRGALAASAGSLLHSCCLSFAGVSSSGGAARRATAQHPTEARAEGKANAGAGAAVALRTLPADPAASEALPLRPPPPPPSVALRRWALLHSGWMHRNLCLPRLLLRIVSLLPPTSTFLPPCPPLSPLGRASLPPPPPPAPAQIHCICAHQLH
ncbi:Protein of unknown function [Gryllus bimaculatus]|nr:Protein of unknown function [Gryllus bimaculatus]